MDLMQLLWLFFIASALQPALQRKYLEAMRARKIAQIEKTRASRVILMIHRQETMNLLGFPLVRYIDVNDSEEVLRAMMPQVSGHIAVDLQLTRHLKQGITRTTQHRHRLDPSIRVASQPNAGHRRRDGRGQTLGQRRSREGLRQPPHPAQPFGGIR